jgi:hypothetical protein
MNHEVKRMRKTRKGLFALVAVSMALSLAGEGCVSSRARAAHETAAIVEVQAISKAQILYSLTKGRGQYTDLKTLAAESLIDSALASGEKYGYLFATAPVVVAGQKPMFDVTAKPKSSSEGSRSFYGNETNVIWEAKGAEPPSATAADRTPKNGTAIQ